MKCFFLLIKTYNNSGDYLENKINILTNTSCTCIELVYFIYLAFTVYKLKLTVDKVVVGSKIKNTTLAKMDAIKVIIIDDELSARNVLKNLLKRISNVEVIDDCINLKEGVASIKKHQPDVVLLDVQMPNYAGYEIVNFFSKIDFEIIFVTAYDKYAIKAFEINAIGYLVKPVERDKLNLVFDKLNEKLQQKKKLEDYKKLLQQVTDKSFNQVVIPELGNRRVVNVNDIIAIKADGAYSEIFLTKGKNVITSKNLKHFESILASKSFFFRAHRTWVINLNHIRAFNKGEKTVTMFEERLSVKISRNRMEAFEKVVQI